MRHSLELVLIDYLPTIPLRCIITDKDMAEMNGLATIDTFAVLYLWIWNVEQAVFRRNLALSSAISPTL